MNLSASLEELRTEIGLLSYAAVIDDDAPLLHDVSEVFLTLTLTLTLTLLHDVSEVFLFFSFNSKFLLFHISLLALGLEFLFFPGPFSLVCCDG